MKQIYKISVVSDSKEYDENKEFRFTVGLTPQEFLEICGMILCKFPHLQTPDEVATKGGESNDGV